MFVDYYLVVYIPPAQSIQGNIEFITIASTGDSTDLVNLTTDILEAWHHQLVVIICMVVMITVALTIQNSLIL